MSFLEVKGQLAKLLATENLHVQHDGTASTASFNTATRVLTLPILTVDSSHVYDMFVGHEVGHALYTPTNWREAVDESVPFDFVNVIEDVRIERLIQAKFPGLRVDFSHGYTELNNRDFFDIADKDLTQLSFIDRINLHFKLGSRALIQFSDEEKVYVNAVDEADTFDKVCLVAKMLADYTNKKREEELQNNLSTVPNEDGEDDEAETEPQTDTEAEMEQQPEAKADTPELPQAKPDELVSQTQRAMDEAMSDLAETGTEVVYLTTPKTELSAYPLDFLREDFKSSIAQRADAAGPSKLLYSKFLASIKRDVNFMVQQFEMKKSADAYARQQIHKTGVLNTDVLHAYKLTDDVFLRQTITPDGKNHGLFMLIDWSGSMSDNILPTVKQLLVLVQFCRKVNIPFDVYTFTSTNYSVHYKTCDHEYDNGEILLDSVSLTHVLSSKAKRREIDEDMYHLFCQAHKIMFPYSGSPYSNQLQMGGTPLNNVLFGAANLIRKFKRDNNLQKVSFVCLTDGESAPTHFACERAYGMTTHMTNPYFKTLVRDGHQVYQIDTKNETPSIVNYLTKILPGVSITNIFLSGPKGAARYKTQLTRKTTDDMPQYKKQGAESFTTTNGWPLVALVNPRSFTDSTDEIEVEAGASKAKVKSALRKFLKTKTTAKLLLSTLVSQFS